jgi:hypothetical protein
MFAPRSSHSGSSTRYESRSPTENDIEFRNAPRAARANDQARYHPDPLGWAASINVHDESTIRRSARLCRKATSRFLRGGRLAVSRRRSST